MLADYAASYVDKNTAVLSLCPGRTKTTQALSAVVALSTPLFAMTADYNDEHRRPSSAAHSSAAPVPADSPRDSRDVSVIKAAARDSSVGTCLSGYTAIFVFFLSVSPDFTLHSLYDSGSDSLLVGQVLGCGC